jgi:hypothetical protein
VGGQGGNASRGGGGDDVGICDEKVHCKTIVVIVYGLLNSKLKI